MIELVSKKPDLTITGDFLKGDTGGHYTPNVDEEGNLTWTPSEEGMAAVEPTNIKGPIGETGPEGKSGVWTEETTPPDGYNVWICQSGEAEPAITFQQMEEYVDDAIAAIDLPDPTVAASGVTFDDTAAGIGAANVQEAIEYLADSGITSEVVQEQIDENRFWGSATLFDLTSGANVPYGASIMSVSNPTQLFSTLRQNGVCSWYITSSANKPTYKQLYDEGYRYILYCLGSSITMDRALSTFKDSDSTWDLPSYGNSIYQWGNALVVAHSKLDFKKAISKIYYDNSTSGLKATTLPAAIDELKTLIGSGGGGGLTEDEVNTLIDNKIAEIVNGNEVSY